MYKSQTKSVYGVCDLIVSCCFVPRPSPFLLSVCVYINTQERKSSTPVYCCEYKQRWQRPRDGAKCHVFFLLWLMKGMIMVAE